MNSTHATPAYGLWSLVARIRHPQYVGFVIILFGFLLQWPTILTLAMFPVLVFMYGYLARSEEARMAAEFGAQYKAYASRTLRYFPKLWSGPGDAHGRLA